MEILFIDSAARSSSRTRILAQHLLSKLVGSVTCVKPLELGFLPVDEVFLNKRNEACASGDYSDIVFEPARQFAQADVIVIAAPYWDLSFPAVLKQYFEYINVLGLTFCYTAQGEPVGLCKASKLYYVTTSGGKILSDEYGFGYVKALAETFYGISEVKMFKAEMLDIEGSDAEKIMSDAMQLIDNSFAAK